MTSSDEISYISYDLDSIVRSSPSKNAPAPKPATADEPVHKDLGENKPASTANSPAASDKSHPAPEAAGDADGPRPIDAACNEEPAECEPTNPPSYGYFYSMEDKKCERSPFANCKGSKNNFDTEEKCKDACIRK